jgi:hypothetical protein
MSRQGAFMGEAFIDDYISTQEQVYVVYFEIFFKVKE